MENLTQLEHTGLEALRSAVENTKVEGKFSSSYLPVAEDKFMKETGKNAKTFAAILGCLTKKGFYQEYSDPDYSDTWGDVLC